MSELKLNNKRTILVGLAFLYICQKEQMEIGRAHV